MRIIPATRRHTTRMFWLPLVAIEISECNSGKMGKRRWIEVYWLRWNLSIMIDP